MGFLTPKAIMLVTWCGKQECNEASIIILALIFLFVVAHVMYKKWEKPYNNE